MRILACLFTNVCRTNGVLTFEIIVRKELWLSIFSLITNTLE